MPCPQKNTKSRRGDPVWSLENSQFTIKIVGQRLAPAVVLLNNPYTDKLSSTAPKPLGLVTFFIFRGFRIQVLPPRAGGAVTFVACDKSNQKHAFGCARRTAVALNARVKIPNNSI